jgi:uncharacterized membrane protein
MDFAPSSTFVAFIAIMMGLFSTPNKTDSAEFNKFDLTVCNKTSAQVHVSIFHEIDSHEPEQWAITAWFIVPRRECMLIGQFLRGYYYLYIEQKNGKQWNGRDRWSAPIECSTLNVS